MKANLYSSLFYTDSAEKLFDLVDSFAESAKRKAAVWPLQIILLILCPEITQSISKEVVEESKANKVEILSLSHIHAHTKIDYIFQPFISAVLSVTSRCTKIPW